MRPMVRAAAFALLCTASLGFLSAQAGAGKIVLRQDARGRSRPVAPPPSRC